MTLFNKKIITLSGLIITGFASMAQAPEPAVLTESNNLEVVYGVVLIIMFGMFSYLFYIDRKVKRLEDKFEAPQPQKGEFEKGNERITNNA